MKKLFLSLVCFLLLAFISSTSGFVFVRTGPPAGGTSCTAWITQTENNDYWSISNPTCQKIKNSSARTICRVDIEIYSGTGTAHIEVWSDANATGTQYGADSDSESISGGGLYTFEWSGTKPNPSSDFFLHVVEDSGDLSWQSHTDETKYEDTNYDAWRGGAEITGNNDFAFIIYTE